MDLVAYTGIFILGGVSAVLIMGLLFRFLHQPRQRVRDDQFLQEIASALLSEPGLKQPAARLKARGAKMADFLETRPEKGVSPGNPGAARRLGMAYTPVSELH
jgi:hypothetical protein